MAVRREILPEGLRLVLEDMPHMESVAVSVWVGAGSRHEPEGLNGVSHFIEHLLFKGTKKRKDNLAISLAIEGVGGMLNGFTNKEATCYIAKVPARHLELALDVLADMVFWSLFAPESVERERGVVVEEIRMARDRPDAWVHILLANLMWPDQPLGRAVAGTEETLTAMSRDEVLAYYARHYRSSNMVVSVAGRHASSDLCLRSVASWFAKPAPPVPPAPHASPAPPSPSASPASPAEGGPGGEDKAIERGGGPVAVVEKRDTKQANLVLATTAYHRLHPDRYALDLLSLALGGGMSSRLFQEVRVKRGLAYAVGSHYQAFRDTGLFRVSAGVDPRKGAEALRVCLDEMARLTREVVGPAELDVVKELYKGSLVLWLEDTLNHSVRNGESELLMGRVIPVDEIVASIDAVTPDDIQRVAVDLFRPERLYLAAVGPFEDEAALRNALTL